MTTAHTEPADGDGAGQETAPATRRVVRVLDAVLTPVPEAGTGERSAASLFSTSLSAPPGAPTGPWPPSGSTLVPTPRRRDLRPGPGRHRALPAPPDLWTPPPGALTCSCGTELRAHDDVCSFCGLARPARLPGLLRLSGRHWLAGLPRRSRLVTFDTQGK